MTAEEPRPDWAFLGACVRRDRRARRWTQEELADRAGLALRTIGKYERGEGPSGDAVPSGYFAVARALGWRRGTVEEYLFGPEPDAAGTRPRGDRNGSEALVAAYRGVQDLLVLAVELGAPAASVRRFSDAAGDLLQAVAAGTGTAAAHGLAANSPVGGPPSDDDAVRALAATADLPDVTGEPHSEDAGFREVNAADEPAVPVPHSRRRAPDDPHAGPSSAATTNRRNDP